MIKEHLYEIEQYMLKNAGVTAHESDHIYRVLNQALIIAKDYNVNEDILVASCLLHDIGRPSQLADPSICHAKIGSEMAYEFLKGIGWNEEYCQRVKHCNNALQNQLDQSVAQNWLKNVKRIYDEAENL